MNTAEVDLYLRLSIARDGSDSIDRQEADLRAWAQREGLVVRKVWTDEGRSGYKKRVVREQFLSAVKAVTSGEVQTLAVWKLDRLSRRGAGQIGTLMDELEESGGRVVFLKDLLDTSVSAHRLPIMFVSEQARTESANTALRVLSKNESSVAKGLPVAGKRRFGFEPGNVTERAEEAAQVRKAYADLLGGRSLRSIAAEWGRDPARLREVLTNPAYAGYVVRAGVKYEAHESVARIVERDVWNAAQDLLTDEARRTSPGPARKHLLSGIARCGECGAKMRVLSRGYRCTDDTSHPQMKREDLEWRAITELFGALLAEEPQPTSAPLAALARQLEELEAERTRWTAVAALPGADMAQVGRELARLSQDAQTAQDALTRARVSDAHADLAEMARGTAQDIIQVTRENPERPLNVELDMGAWFDFFNGLELDARRDLIASKLDITVYKGRGQERVKVAPKNRVL